MKTLSWAAGALAIGASAAAAAQSPGGRPSQVDQILACQGEKDEQRRLACYDRAAAALADAARSGSVVVVDREDVRKTRRSLFGFNLPRLPFFSGDASQEEEEAKGIEAKIQSARPAGYGKWLLVLDNGATWQTTDPETRYGPPTAGQAVSIKKAALGSYLLSVENRRSVRALRVR